MCTVYNVQLFCGRDYNSSGNEYVVLLLTKIMRREIDDATEIKEFTSRNICLRSKEASYRNQRQQTSHEGLSFVLLKGNATFLELSLVHSNTREFLAPGQ